MSITPHSSTQVQSALKALKGSINFVNIHLSAQLLKLKLLPAHIR